ncbi:MULTISPECIES: alkaline phosphatase family protein [Niastella]|uniref:Alkaline phosphatase family protein n=1 Tax=Niastella soli TaxID=2821487 RepID=A0ABS3YYZ9_9BACT|nr:ectonucleotide pyrophosphatase/phosphodiesterase [Niastella soli]MBO9203151.1 alkaline phosphatase family protein [Niastella soli]
MRIFIAILIMFFPAWLVAQVDITQHTIPGRSNSKKQQEKPYVILISVDGLRYDLVDKYHATHLQQLRSKGVAAKSMIPSYPSLTFPNHYTLVTGLYPAHHGLVDNTFYDKKRNETYRLGNRKAVEDSSWYNGTPLWVLAEQQQMVTASFYWVGSETAVKGVRPTYYYRYNDSIDIDSRIQQVKNWLQLPEDKRPHLITFYLPQVDHEEHMFGPESKQAEEAVQFVDESIHKMVRMTDSLKLPINYILLSDHGMIAADTVHQLPMPSAIDTTKFKVPDGDVLVHLYANDTSFVQSTYQALKKEAVDYDVYLANEIPARWHYSAKDDHYQRIGDMILVPHAPKSFNFRRRRSLLGKHGFDNALPEMQATFYAWGPAFKKQLNIPAFENVHVYPLVAKILGLTITDKIDGSLNVLRPVLKGK